MAQAIPEIRIAVFGPRGSGKTVLLSSYYGNQQRNAFEEAFGYRLEAEDAQQGNDLLQLYYQLERGRFPRSTDLFGEYRFALKVHDLHEPGLRVVWFDYPGEWWHTTPPDPAEQRARREGLTKLLSSHVGVLLLDGAQYQSDGIAYVRSTLDQFRNEARKLVDDAAAIGQPLSAFPQQWVIALSKADLFTGSFTAETLCKDLLADAQDQLRGVAKVLNSDSFGTQFLLLSSVQGDGRTVTDAHAYVGLQLLAPVALLAVVNEAAKNADRGRAWGLARAALERLAALVEVVDRLDDFLPEKYQVLTLILRVFATQDLISHGQDYFRQKQAEAARRGRAMEAAVAAMKAELVSTAAQRAYFSTRP